MKDKLREHFYKYGLLYIIFGGGILLNVLGTVTGWW